MRKIPPDLSGSDVVKALAKVGFELSRQRGSHMILYRSQPTARVSIPNHKPVRVGTLRQIIADAGLTVDEFLALL